jgi:glycosyltransferase involved in cell wall biosynthesis
MVDLSRLEAASYGRMADRIEIMIETLAELAKAREAIPEGTDKAVTAKTIATRAAAAIGAILADPLSTASRSQRDRIWPLRKTIETLFLASEFGSSDFILEAIGLPDPKDNDSRAELRLALLGLHSALDFDESPFQLAPDLRQIVYASLISTLWVGTAKAEARRNALLAAAARIEPAPLPPGLDQLMMVSHAWMLSSYGSHPEKHRIKAVFNETLKRHLAALALTPAELPAPRGRPARPTMVVAAEVMNSKHVQYRYFGQYLRQLRSRFRLVLVTEASEVDEPVRALFDELLTFTRNKSGDHLGEAVRLIKSAEPDIVFWPSVGMAHWGPLLANLRLAPIQMTALGHSASTFAETIDYFLLEEGYVSDPALLSETLILLPDESLRFERAPGHKAARPQIREAATPLRVALPSSPMKLNPNFLSLLCRIRAEAKRPVEFNFMPNIGGFGHEALRTAIQAMLPGAKVHPVLPHNLYRALISSCDLTLSPFPFGGLHSVVDSLHQGLPVVAMECPEPHGRTDAMLLRRLGMPDWLVARDEDEYVAAALRIIDDDALRAELSQKALDLDIDNRMFGDGDSTLGSDVVDAVWWVYQNHEAIQASGRKAWTAGDRREIPLA